MNLPGLNAKETQVYEALLYLGVASVLKIAEHSELKRPTVYLQLDELKKKGLVIQVPQGNKILFKAVDPARLKELAEEQLKSVQEAMPKLQHLMERQAGRPKITFLEGREGIKSIYRELTNAPDIRFWCNLEAVSDLFLNNVDDIAKSVKTKKIPVREIIGDTLGNRKACRHFRKLAGKTYIPRHAMPEHKFENDNFVYGDVVAICRLLDNNLFVVRIEDPTIAQTYKTLFDMAWKAAKPFL
jgi:predicted transcriptional regulator